MAYAGALVGGPWAFEEHLVAQHGFSYVLVECSPMSDGKVMEQLVTAVGVLRRLHRNEQGLEDFGAFCVAHKEYLRALVSDFDSWARFE